MTLRALCALALSFAFVLPAFAERYEYRFLANPEADQAVAANPAQDIALTFGFDTAQLPTLDLAVLNRSEHWLSGAIWLTATFQGQTVDLGATLVAQTRLGLTFKGTGGDLSGGFIEAYSNIDDFLDIDLHPGAFVVERNGLPYDPFVYGQIDAYNAQADFQDAHRVWALGDHSSLPSHLAPAVPEPATGALWALGLTALACLGRSRQRRG